MAITIITDPISISINENVSGRNHIDLGSLVLTDQRWAGLTFTLTSATDDDGNEVVGFSLVLVDGIYKIRYQRQVGLDAEETSTVRLNIAASDGTEIAPIVVQVNDLNDTPPFIGEYITASDSVFIFESNKIPSDRVNKNYFQSSVDLIANWPVRAGAEGTGEITITLLRDDGVITITSEILGMSATGSQNYFIWAVRNGNDWSLIAKHNTGNNAPPGYEEAQFLYVLNYASGYAAVQKAADGTRILKKYPSAILLNVKEDAEVGSLIFKLPDVHSDTGAEVVNVIFIEGYGTDSEYFTFNAQTREIRLAKAIDYEAEEHYSIVFQITSTSGGKTQFLQQWVIANVVNVDDNGPIFADFESQGLNTDSDNNGTLAVPIQITDTATIFTAMASDADGDDIVYSITSGNTSGMFEIDANTGVVSLAQGRHLTVPLIFDYELTITATSTSAIYGSAPKIATQIVKLEVVSVFSLQFSRSNISIKEADFGATPYELADVTVTAGSQFTFITSDERFEVVNGKLRIKANSVFDFESLRHPIINVSVHAQKEGYLTIGENFRLTVEDANDLPPIFKHNVESTAGNFLYKAPVVYNGSSFHYYEADVDLYLSQNVARAFAGTNPIGITLYTDQGPIRLSGNIENFNNPTEKQAYVVWAVRRGNEWSLTVVENYYAPPTEGIDQALYMHTYAITSAGYKVMIGSTAVPTGETAFVGTPTVLNIDTDENQAVDTVIYTVPSAIPDVSAATVTYTLLESGHYQYFTLDAVTRELKVKTVIDAETITELTIIVRATAVEGTGDSQRTTTADQIINIDVNYVDEYLPVFSNPSPGPQNRHALDVNENHDENVVIYTAQATDLDAGETVTYRITSQTHDGLFVIDPTTGEVKLAAGTILDAEQYQSSIEVVITAYSGEPERASDPLYLDINLINLNDNSPHMSITGTQVQLEEGTYYRDAETGYSVSAIDADGGDVVYTISDNRFFVDADGMLMVKSGSVLDFETEPNIRITFTAMDSGVGGPVPAGQDSSVTEEITINLTDFDENLPPPTNITFEAQSGTWIEGVSRVNASFIVGFSAINSQNYEFSVDDDRFYIVGNNVILKAGETFDYETETSVVLTISGSKPTSPVVTGTFTLNIIDANDLKPEFESTVDVAYAEGLSIDTVVHTVTEAIPDTAAAVVTYELLQTGDHNYFEFDQATRQLKVKQNLDRLDKSTYTVTVRATATEGSDIQYADQVITFTSLDTNDEAPIFGEIITASEADNVYLYKVSVPSPSTEFYHLQTNFDLSDNGNIPHGALGTGAITITLIRGSGSIAITGEIANLPNAAPSATYGVYAVREGSVWSLKAATDASQASSPLTGDEVVKLFSVEPDGQGFDINGANQLSDGLQIIKTVAPTLSFTLSEDTAVNHVIHTISAAVPDAPSAVVTYELLSTGDHSFFDFDEQTRVLKIKNKLDHEVKPVFTVTIRATATHGEGASQEVQTADQIIQVVVTDVNDTAPRISRAKILYDVNFGKLSTLTRHNLNFTDPDLNEQEPEEYTYTLLSTARGVTFYKKGVELAANSTFTHLELLNGLITYKITNINFLTGVTFSVSEPQNTSLNITTMVFEMWATPPQQSNNNNPGEGGVTSINLATVNENHLIRTGNGIDHITASRGSDEIHAGKGDDIIILDGDLTDAHTGGEDTIIYNFIGSEIFVAADGGDKIIGFRRGEDVLVFNAITDDPRLQNKEGFFNYLSGKNKADSIDDFLIISPLYELSAGSTNLENLRVKGILFHFQGASTYGTGNIAEGSVSITFDQVLSWAEFSNLIAITDDNGVRSNNFDFGRGIISDISILPSLLGSGSFVFRTEGPEFGPITIPELVVNADPSDNRVTGTSATELLLGDQSFNRMNTNGGDDLVVLGTGTDYLILDSGSETVFYRFKSSNDANGKSVAVDGENYIYDFEFGKDKLILVDTNPIHPFDSVADFSIFSNQLDIRFFRTGQNITGIELKFNEESTHEKARSGILKSLLVYFDESTFISSTEQAKWEGLTSDGLELQNPGYLSLIFGDTLDVVGIDLLPPELVFV